MLSFLLWSMQINTVGGMFGWRVTRQVLWWSLKTGLWSRFYFVTLGTTLAPKESRLSPLTSIGRVIVVRSSLRIWVIRYKAMIGFRCCLSLFRLTSSSTGPGSLVLGCRSQMFLVSVFCFSLFSVFLLFLFTSLRVLA